MQQEHVLAEFQEYATQTPPPTDAPSVTNTVAYLKACNQLFERGILGKRVFIKSPSNQIIASMDEGFTYFTTWLDCELSKGITSNLNTFGITKLCLQICLYIHASRIYHHPNYKQAISLMANVGSTQVDVLWVQRIL